MDPVGLKVLERHVFLSTSEIKVGKEQSDHDGIDRGKTMFI